MTTSPDPTPDQEQLGLDEALAAVLQALDREGAGQRESWIARYGEFSGELRDFFELSDRLEQLTFASGETLVVKPEMAVPVPEPTAVDSGVRTFGDYDLLEMIAKGGMGVVYKARQRKLNRLVAVKMILAGQFADQVDVDRFYAEAEAAAKLRHPNIVGIFEVGQWQDQHFFSMEFIDGQTLAQMVRENPLPPRIAATYLKSIAEAMQYAHEEGILHRDLKPGNVLVSPGNEPMITDFGLAKQVEAHSQLTVSGAIVGTPSYMPPEQASGISNDVDVRSDTYSIGAILYEMLAGSPPFRAATPFETIRQVLSVEPVSPRLLNPDVPADLETICLKCLQKEPNRRYQTAQEIADELDRYLSGRPIEARPISHFDRALRWCRRNPVIATLSAAALIGFLAAFVSVTYAYLTTSEALEQTKLARNEAEFNYRQARSVVDDLLTRVSEDTLLNQYGMQPLRRELLEKALTYYRKFLARPGTRSDIGDEVAVTYFRVGLITEQIASAQEALEALQLASREQQQLLAERPADVERLEALSNTHSALGRVLIKMDNPSAVEELRRASELRHRLVKLDNENAEYQRKYANAVMNEGLFQRARQEYELARRLMEHSQEIRRTFIDEFGPTRSLQVDLGKCDFNLANLALDIEDSEAAEQKLKSAIGVFKSLQGEQTTDFDNDLRLLTCYSLLGDLKGAQVVMASEDPERAAALFDETAALYGMGLEIGEPLARRNPVDQRFQMALGRLYFGFGQLHRDAEKIDEAMALFRQAESIRTTLARDYPQNLRYRQEYRETLANMIALLMRQPDSAEVSALLAKLIAYYEEIRRQLHDAEARQAYQGDPLDELVDVYLLAGDVHYQAQRLADATEAYGLAVNLLETFVRDAPDNEGLRYDAASTQLSLAELQLAQQQSEDARQTMAAVRRHLDVLLKRAPSDEGYLELQQILAKLQGRQ